MPATGPALARSTSAPTPRAHQTINHWVSGQARGRIPQLLARGDLTPVTELVLTNAVYFKGIWAARFDPRATSQRPFRIAGGSVTRVPMQQQTGRFAHAGVDALLLLEIPYTGSALVMDILLPDDVEGLPVLEARLSPERLRSGLPVRHRRFLNGRPAERVCSHLKVHRDTASEVDQASSQRNPAQQPK